MPITNNLRGGIGYIPSWTENCGSNPSINEILDEIDAQYLAGTNPQQQFTLQGQDAYSDSKFTWEEIEPGGDGRIHHAVYYESDEVDKIKVSEIDERGIHASIRYQRGSHFEAFVGSPVEQASNPNHRLNSYPYMRLELGSGFDETDVYFGRIGHAQGAVLLDRSEDYEDMPIIADLGGVQIKDIWADGDVNILSLGAEKFNYSGTITGQNFGSELVTNGGFATDSDWTKGAGWTISGGTANHAQGTESNLFQTIGSISASKAYKIVYTVSNRTAGWLECGIGVNKAERSITNDTFTKYIVAPSTGSLQTSVIFKGSAKFDGSIDNVSVKEATDWYESNNLYRGFQHATGNTNPLAQDVSAVASEVYLLMFTVGSNEEDDALVGSVTPSIGNTAGTAVSSKGTSRQLITASNTDDLEFTPTSDFNGYVANISVREMTNAILNVQNVKHPLAVGGGVQLGVNGFAGVGTATPSLPWEVYEDGSLASPLMGVEQDGDGDATFRWLLTGVRAYSMGIDNSVTNDPLCIAAGASAAGGLSDEKNAWRLFPTGRSDIKVGETTSPVQYARMGGVIDANVTEVGNVGVGEDDLMTSGVAADTLYDNGDIIEFTMAGTFANNVNNKRIRIYYGATTIFDTTALAFQNSNWHIEGKIMKSDTAEQKISVTFISDDALLPSSAQYTTGAEDNASAHTLKATGEATNDDDIVQELLNVQWFPENA